MDIQILLDLCFKLFLLLSFRVNEFVVFSQSKLSLIILSTSQYFSLFCQHNGEIGACCHVHHILIAQSSDFDRVWAFLVSSYAQLPMLIQSPPVIRPSLALTHLRDGVIPSAPHILYIADPHALEGKTALGLVPGVDATTHSVGFWFSSDVYLLGDQDGAVVAARDHLGQFGFSVAAVADGVDIEQFRHLHRLHHLLPTHVLVVTREVNLPGPTASEDGVVVSSRNQVYLVIQPHLCWHLLRTLSTQCSFVVTPETVHSPFRCGHHSMQGSTCNLDYCCISQRVGDDGFVRLFVLVLLGISFRLEVLNVRDADGPFGLVILAGVVVLVGLARTEHVKLEDGRLSDSRL